MKEFEDALIGASAGETKEFNATFAAEHTNKKLAGKTATFTVKVEKVEEQAPACSTKPSPRASALPTAASTSCAAK